MRPFDWVVIKVWSGTMSGRILYGETPLDLIESYTEYSGRMRALPDWVHSGVILGVAGGTAAVRAKLNNARMANIPVAGLWIQDWVGVRITPVGTHTAVVELAARRDLLSRLEGARGRPRKSRRPNAHLYQSFSEHRSGARFAVHRGRSKRLSRRECRRYAVPQQEFEFPCSSTRSH
jgi:hypothetical protein